ncbi:mycofactocin-associated electron transfer flavoprotein beta subunit [Amycolatopsis sp. H20-H5]|uniref:mycofactocin-associated electron transfer flavoprotein beta subunit n=1 Tax=Amycolatopsis sp. H20-H5 TaxID=3046309 RepID=UPI002DBA2F52|nr:mycofactocin-associated electron transfer flavoprotein beta subunit [Amycolatopsis sp. H20-H5]MEC3977298.1 mycofactocin-associated electron transfer flavoprotein beta subunit [Amycolatopsis sp. H20-H5]
MPVLVVVALRLADTPGGLSVADECALEYALRLAAARDGECLAVTAGPPAADVVLRTALAAGADRVLRIAMVEGPADDGSRAASAIAAAIAERGPDLVVCGDYSADRGTGATPAFLAAAMGARQVLGVLEPGWGPGGALLAERRLDGGRRERVRAETPVVCSVEPADVRLRRASLPAMLAAKSAPVPCAIPESSTVDARVRLLPPVPFRPRTRRVPAPEGAGPRERLLALTGALDEHDPPRLVRPADAGAAATELLNYLRQHGYLP